MDTNFSPGALVDIYVVARDAGTKCKVKCKNSWRCHGTDGGPSE